MDKKEQNARMNEIIYQEIFDSSSDAILIHDSLSGAIIDVNRTMLEIYGFTDKEDVLGGDVSLISAAEEGYTSERAGEMIRKTLASGKNSFEWRAKKRNGEVFWADVILHPVTLVGQERVMATVRDISDRKRIEQALVNRESDLQSEKKFIRLLLDTSPAFIVALNFEGRIIMMNQALLDVLEYTMEELQGTEYISTVVPPNERQKLQHLFERIIIGTESTVNENSIISKSGKIHLVEWHGRVVRHEGDEGDFFIGAGVDITERKKSELELQSKNEELTAMNEEMEAANEELIAVNEEMEAANEELITVNHELLAAEEKYRGVVETQSDMIARFMIDGTITFVNRAWRKYYGEHLGFNFEVIGKNIADLIQTGNFSQMREYLESLKPGELSSMERSFVSADGKTRWQLWHIKKILNQRSNTLEYQVVGNDITDRKIAETALRESEEKFRSLIELAPDAILIGNFDAKIIGANRKTYELTGYSSDDLIGSDIRILFDKEELAVSPLRFDLLKQGHLVRVDRMLTRKDGVKLHTEMTSRMMPDNSYQVFIRDITQRKMAEDALAAEKEQLSVTLRSIGDGVITTDTAGKILIMNRVAEDLTGWRQDEAAGRPLSEVFNIINELSRVPCENPVNRILATGQIVELENHTLLVSRDGTERIVSDSGAPIKDKNSMTTGVVLVFRDMTEKRKFLDALQQTDKLASLGILAGGIAHDFNNLLGGIFGYIEMARLKSAQDMTVGSYLDRAMTVYNRARDLTQQLLTFSKGGTPVRRPGNMGILLRESSSFALSGSNIVCEYNIDTSLKLCDFDENQIGQVIDNIIINAKQAMPLGGRIVISASNCELLEGENPVLHAGEYIKISIADTGIGIAPDMLKRIFDPFFTTKQQGNGLGLAICYSIIQKHDGYIEVESVQGRGTVFNILLPVSEREADEKFTGGLSVHRGQGMVLVMDDEDFIREIAGEMLSAMGYTVLGARDGDEAMKLWLETERNGERIAAAFFDLTIQGGMGGKALIMEIRKVHPDTPVFASSGFSEDHVMSHPRDYGFTDSVRKPYRFEELSAVMDRYMKKHSAG